ncbi:MAG: hypothetical protein KDD55_04250 [Bdellovibrionales bacterium]|nr:hypothetical protein [Bdellovibrionales bacterium]
MMYRLVLLLLISVSLLGCESLSGNERGVRFWNIPPLLGGGLSQQGIGSAESYLSLPYLSRVYAEEIQEKSVGWGMDSPLEFFSQDGLRYQLTGESRFRLANTDDSLLRFLSSFGEDFDKAEDLVSFFVAEKLSRELGGFIGGDLENVQIREEQIHVCEEALRETLRPFGLFLSRIYVEDLRLAPSFLERKQEMVNQEKEVQRALATRNLDPQISRQKKEALARQLERKIVAAQSRRDELKEEGERYFRTKSNEAERIRIRGLAQVQTVQKRLQAMTGPNAKAMLKLEVVKELVKDQPPITDAVRGASQVSGTQARVLAESVLLDGEVEGELTTPSQKVGDTTGEKG